MAIRSGIKSFPPVFTADAEILILGSMPGVESLRMRQYYAHPQNRFWRIMGEIFGFTVEAPYERRLEILLGNDIALWDVIKSCEREGSLDSKIRNAVPNNFRWLFMSCPKIRTVFFNGRSPENLFLRHVPEGFPGAVKKNVLPSTSPANASMSYEKKLLAWREGLYRNINSGDKLNV